MSSVDDKLTALADQVTENSTDIQAILGELVRDSATTKAQAALIDQVVAILKAQDNAVEAIRNPPDSPGLMMT